MMEEYVMVLACKPHSSRRRSTASAWSGWRITTSNQPCIVQLNMPRATATPRGYEALPKHYPSTSRRVNRIHRTRRTTRSARPRKARPRRSRYD